MRSWNVTPSFMQRWCQILEFLVNEKLISINASYWHRLHNYFHLAMQPFAFPIHFLVSISGAVRIYHYLDFFES